MRGADGAVGGESLDDYPGIKKKALWAGASGMDLVRAGTALARPLPVVCAVRDGATNAAISSRDGARPKNAITSVTGLSAAGVAMGTSLTFH